MVSWINATLGLSVLLPCLIPPPPPPLMDTRIYWQTVEADKSEESSLVLHFYNFGQEEHYHADAKYKNRTSMDLSQVPSGNFSLELKNVTQEDNQTTICCLFSRGRNSPEEINRITLLVLDKPEKPVEGTSTQTWLIAILLTMTLLFICVGAVMFKVLRNRTGCMVIRDAEANNGEGAGLHNVTANGTTHGEKDKEQQSHNQLKNGHG